ncbi:MAG: AMIN domain-containing protein [Deltaproteobacteria bacterium]|nr:AMIN domain-containing protein [Deltaproteobacteria bacterium]
MRRAIEGFLLLALVAMPVAVVAQAAGETDSSVAVASGPRNMTLCGFRFMANVSRVFVRTNYKAEFSVNKMGDNKVIVELPNTNIPLYNNRNFLDTQYFASPVKLITPMVAGGGVTRIEIELKNDVPYQTRQIENEIQIDFPNGG